MDNKLTTNGQQTDTYKNDKELKEAEANNFSQTSVAGKQTGREAWLQKLQAENPDIPNIASRIVGLEEK